jgi:Mrp family chromosome partitioning ATPase/LPS O-antigen subunit length determinant protein (WzzB/FepE family)
MYEKDSPSHRGAGADWIQPPEDEPSLARYLETLRERLWIVVAAVVIATAIAVGYVLTANKQYTAEADLLVTPISSTDIPALGLPGLIPESSDPTRDVETAARLVTNTEVATRVQQKLGTTESARTLLTKVTASPVASSNIVAVTATAGSPAFARDLANAFATQAVANLTEQLHDAIDQALPSLQARLKTSAGGSPADPTSIRAAIASLETLRSAPSPSMSVQTKADTPTGPSSPRTKLSIAAGLLAGLVLGIGGAFTAQALDPRLRREEQLRRRYRLPILTRIPNDPHRRMKQPLGPAALSPMTLEAYRTLRGTLAARRRAAGADSRVILVTGSSPSEGKTTTAINLASSLAMAGASVILIEADLRRPAIGTALDLRVESGVAGVLLESVPLENALVSVPGFDSNLGVLLANYDGGWISDLFSLPMAANLLADARGIADYVILDSPPLADVIDALPLAEHADDVVVVARIGTTHLKKLDQLGELLAENEIKPAGFALIGTRRPSRSSYGYYLRHPEAEGGRDLIRPRALRGRRASS